MSSTAVHDDESPGMDDGCCNSCTNRINRALESLFASIGCAVGNNPWKTIIISLVCCALCFIGTTQYEVENRGSKNWVSQTSDAIKHLDWVDREFAATFRIVSVLLEKDDESNILTSEAIKHLHGIDLQVKEMFKNDSQLQWSSICFKKNGITCQPPKSILEFWSYDDAKIMKLTTDDVTEKLQQRNHRSPMTGQPIVVDALIGEPRTQDANGTITSGSVLKLTYRIKMNLTFDQSKGFMIDNNGKAWEEKLDNLMKEISIPEYTVYSFSIWADNKASGDATSSDLQFFIIGYLLVIVYLSVMLGSFSRLNQKIYLAVSGIVTIGLSIVVAYGLGSALQLKATPVHNVLPFLLLGIGVDDIFVIVQCWDNIGGPKINGKDVDDRTIAEKISLTLKHAGVSVLVTSLTDICAFMVGASTILPALRSFCIWCGIGILSVFLLTLTFFTALLALDAKRQNKNRDACCCVKISKDWTPMSCSKKSHLQEFIRNYYAPALLSVPGKIISMIAIAGFLAGGIYGVAVKLEQDFDYKWFLPSDSPPRMYLEKDEVAFPNDGFFANIYLGEIDYYKEYENMDKIVTILNNDKFIADGTVRSWYESYYAWIKDNHNSALTCPSGPTSCRVKNESLFYDKLNEFLNDPRGKFFSSSIKFKDQTRTSIEASKIAFVHTKFEKAVDEIEGMDSVQGKINPEKIQLDNSEGLLPFAFAYFYISWETNKVISEELGRNLGLAMLCVFLVTLLLLSDFFASFMVLICVVLALVDITGFMAFWGLTIDTVTTIIMVIAIGLTVDYSAHIAHAFMVSKQGDRNERMKNALVAVAPAVINGGFSTFLAFVLLAASTSYVFLTFFRVFFLVVIFGMLHGLVFLPIMLSLIGPRAYASHQNKTGHVTNSSTRNGHINGNGVHKSNPPQNVELKNVADNNEEMFVVVQNGGTANTAYVKEDDKN